MICQWDFVQPSEFSTNTFWIQISTIKTCNRSMDMKIIKFIIKWIWLSKLNHSCVLLKFTVLCSLLGRSQFMFENWFYISNNRFIHLTFRPAEITRWMCGCVGVWMCECVNVFIWNKYIFKRLSSIYYILICHVIYIYSRKLKYI